ncbi:hypothetical protein R6Z07F_003871 [Ovis aries]
MFFGWNEKLKEAQGRALERGAVAAPPRPRGRHVAHVPPAERQSGDLAPGRQEAGAAASRSRLAGRVPGQGQLLRALLAVPARSKKQFLDLGSVRACEKTSLLFLRQELPLRLANIMKELNSNAGVEESDALYPIPLKPHSHGVSLVPHNGASGLHLTAFSSRLSSLL